MTGDTLLQWRQHKRVLDSTWSAGAAVIIRIFRFRMVPAINSQFVSDSIFVPTPAHLASGVRAR
jgi:hypothetical protein